MTKQSFKYFLEKKYKSGTKVPLLYFILPHTTIKQIEIILKSPYFLLKSP